MAPSGRSIASGALLGVAMLLFAPVFADAATGFSYGGWKYGPAVARVLEIMPPLLAAGGVAILLLTVIGGTGR